MQIYDLMAEILMKTENGRNGNFVKSSTTYTVDQIFHKKDLKNIKQNEVFLKKICQKKLKLARTATSSVVPVFSLSIRFV